MDEIDVTEQRLSAPKLLEAFESGLSRSGAIVSFSGTVRSSSSDGGHVRSLFLQAYAPLTQRGIDGAVQTAKTRWPLEAVKVVHRIGEMSPGETIVFVATASAHRRAAFEAADYLMDYLKTEAVFWKKETTQDGAHWIEPRTADYHDAARWAEDEETHYARNQ